MNINQYFQDEGTILELFHGHYYFTRTINRLHNMIQTLVLVYFRMFENIKELEKFFNQSKE